MVGSPADPWSCWIPGTGLSSCSLNTYSMAVLEQGIKEHKRNGVPILEGLTISGVCFCFAGFRDACGMSQSPSAGAEKGERVPLCLWYAAASTTFPLACLLSFHLNVGTCFPRQSRHSAFVGRGCSLCLPSCQATLHSCFHSMSFRCISLEMTSLLNAVL